MSCEMQKLIFNTKQIKLKNIKVIFFLEDEKVLNHPLDISLKVQIIIDIRIKCIKVCNKPVAFVHNVAGILINIYTLIYIFFAFHQLKT